MLLDFIEGNPEYDIDLMSIELEREVQSYPQEMSISLTIEKSDMKIANDLSTEILVSAQLISSEKNEEEDEEKTLFSLKVIYMVSLVFDEGKHYESKEEIDIALAEKYSLFILYPKLRDTIDKLFNDMGLPNISIPFRAVINDNKD